MSSSNQQAVPSRFRLFLAFFAIYIIWGLTYLAALFGLEGMKPFVLSTLRYFLAGLLLTCWIIYRKIELPSARDTRILSLSGILMLVGGSGMVVFAEQYISSGFAAVIVATEPLWFVLFDKKRWNLYFRNLGITLGLLIGFSGIAMFYWFSPDTAAVEQSNRLLGTIITLLSAVFWVLGTLLAAKTADTAKSTVANTTIQLFAAGIVSGMIALVLGEWHQFQPTSVSLKAWGGLFFMVIMGSLVAFMAFNWLVKVQPPAVVSTHTYVNPVVAILAGWLLANEEINAWQGISLVVVLLGVVLAQLGKLRIAPGE